MEALKLFDNGSFGAEVAAKEQVTSHNRLLVQVFLNYSTNANLHIDGR